MFDSNAFFSNPAMSPWRVILDVLNIYASQWRTFLTISLLQAVSLFGTILISSIIIGSFFFFVFIRSSDYDGDVRVGVIIPLLLLFFGSTIAVGWVWCVYAGAMVRGAVETCAGHTPSACTTVAIVSKRGCNMLGFQILFGLIICGGGLVLRKVINWLSNADDYDDDDDFYQVYLNSNSNSNSSSGAIFAICSLYALLLFIANTIMIGATPIIVVEHKSSCDALKRSWNLCKHSICLIFLSVASVNLLSIFVYFMIYALVGRLSVILFAVALVLFIVTSPLSMITATVLYLSIRATSERLTCSELSDALLLTHPELNASLAADEDITNDEYHKETPLLQAEIVSEIV